MKVRATQAIMECLLEQGVDTVFGYPGGTILNDCKYYALYNEDGKATITGGYFSGYPGMKDVYIAGGTVAIQGGYFEDNLTAAADGYVYKDNVQTVGGSTYNYEVVAQ